MERKKKEFSGKTYDIILPSVVNGMDICTRTGHMLIPILPAFVKEKKDFGWDVFVPAMQQTEPVKLNKLLMDAAVLSKLTVGETLVADHALLDFERFFGVPENKQNLYFILFWCLWENVKDFFPQWVASAQEKMKKTMPDALKKAPHKLRSPKAGQ